MREAPGPGPLQTLHDVWALRADPMWPMVQRVREFGDVTRARIPGLQIYTIYRVEHVERVLVSHQDNYVKGPEYELLKPSIGQGLVASSGPLWRRQRSLIQPLFAKRHLEPFAVHMVAAGQHMLDGWEGRSELDVSREMMALALDVVGRALFGEDLSGERTRLVERVMTAALTESISASRSPLVWGASTLPGVTMARALRLRVRGQARLRARMREADELVAAMIRSHRDTAKHDLLSLLLDARDEQTGEPMSDRQVRDEVMTFLAAGHETTANALSWMWWLLSTHPEARDRLQAEVDELLDGRPPSFADAERLLYTRAAVQETLRLYPPIYMLPRRAVRDDEIGGVRIPAGATVMVLIYLTHRDPAVWSNPEGFDPARFLGERRHPRHAFIPFSAGRRVCVGNSFALTEATLLAALIAQRFTLDADPMVRVTPEPLVSLRPRGGLPMRLRRRTQSSPERPSVEAPFDSAPVGS